MPRFAKGSPEMKAHMAKLRAMRSKSKGNVHMGSGLYAGEGIGTDDEDSDSDMEMKGHGFRGKGIKEDFNN